MNCPLCLTTTTQFFDHPVLPAWTEAEPESLCQVCEGCKTRFEREDAFSEQFFKVQSFLRRALPVNDVETEVVEVEYHHKNSQVALLYFLVSLTWRQHLNMLAKGEDLLGGSFERITNDYRERILEEQPYGFMVTKHPSMEQVSTLPGKARFEDLAAVEMTVWGYSFVLVTDKRGVSEDSLIPKFTQGAELIVMVDDGFEEVTEKRLTAFKEMLPVVSPQKMR